MKKKWNLHVYLFFIVAILAAIFGFRPENLLTAEVVTGSIDVYKVNFQEEERLRTTKWTSYEVSKILESVTTMKVSAYRQLPDSYLLFKFDRPVALDDGKVPFAVTQMIVSLPKNKWDDPDMMLLNPQGQWIQYGTDHPLTMLTRDYR